MIRLKVGELEAAINPEHGVSNVALAKEGRGPCQLEADLDELALMVKMLLAARKSLLESNR